jgi:hypothetical protein
VSSKRGSDRLHSASQSVPSPQHSALFISPAVPGVATDRGIRANLNPHASVFTSGCGPREICEVPLGYEVHKRQFSNPLTQFLVSAIPANLGAVSRDVQFDLQLIAPIWRQLTGQAYCDLLSAACTDDDQINDLTVVRSIQRVLQIDDVARARAVDSND